MNEESKTPAPQSHLVGIQHLSDLVDIVAKETGALEMIDADEDSVGWSDAGPLPMTFGHVRRAAAAVLALGFPPQPLLSAIRTQAIEDVLAALTAHELYLYRPKAFEGFIQYARETLIQD